MDSAGFTLLLVTVALVSVQVSSEHTPNGSPAGCDIGEFTCADGNCIDRFQFCDRSEDCDDGSDEVQCDTCYALMDIDEQIEGNATYSYQYSYYYGSPYCDVSSAKAVSGVCDTLYCYGILSYVSQALTILPCYSPPAVQLRWFIDLDEFSPYEEGYYFLDQIFTETETISTTVGGITTVINLVLNHKENSIGIQEDMSRDGLDETFIKYTEIPIDTSQCTGGETGNADTCNAMQGIANQLNSMELYGTCSKDSDCLAIECEGDDNLRLTVLPCYSPPAVKLDVTNHGTSYLDHTFSRTEAASVTIDGLKTIIRLSLDHPDDTTILLRVDVVDSGFAGTIIPYTPIPLDTSTCPGSKGMGNIGNGDGRSDSGDGDGNGLVIGLAVGIPVLILCSVGVGILVGAVIALRYWKKRDKDNIQMHSLEEYSDD